MKENLMVPYTCDLNTNLWARAGSAGHVFFSADKPEENGLYRIIREVKDRSLLSEELEGAIAGNTAAFQLDAGRANLIRPVLGAVSGPVLEVGAGCGTITRLLGEAGLDVVALERRRGRAMIAAERCRDLENVRVIAESLHEFETGQRFSTVFLIGVLETARLHFPANGGGDCVDLMLERAVSLLAPGGVLVVAASNQLGLKYFAGHAERHLQQPMAGIEDRYNSRSAVTFGKAELLERLRKAGLPGQQVWYPFPGYRQPVSVFRDDAFGAAIPADFSGLLRAADKADDARPSIPVFSTDFAWSPVLRNGLAGDLANAFLVLASAEEIAAGEVFGHHFSPGRAVPYRTATGFGKDADGYYASRSLLAASNDDEAAQAISIRTGKEPLLAGRLWKDELQYIVARDGWPVGDLGTWAAIWWDAVRRKAQIAGALKPEHGLPGEMFDLTPARMVFDESGNTGFMEPEWSVARDIEAGYLLFRGIYQALADLEFCARSSPDAKPVILSLLMQAASAAGMALTEAHCSRYLDIEKAFGNMTRGRKQPPTALETQIPEQQMAQRVISRHMGAIHDRDAEIARLRTAMDQMQQHVAGFSKSIEARFAQYEDALREKDAEISRLRLM